MAGLLHDCCKFKTPDGSDDTERLIKYLSIYEPAKINGITGAYHSWVAPYYIEEKLDYHDKQVLNAIYNHTILESDDKLSLILYIADKREPLRGVNDNLLELASVDLNKAYNILKKDVEEFVRRKNERFIENSI